MPERHLYLGLMSGTSLDGVDGVVVAGLNDPAGRDLQVLATAHCDFDQALRDELLALNTAGGDELHRSSLAANRLALAYADVCAALLGTGGVSPDRVQAIGAHGQTVRHRPGGFDGVGYTVQLDPGPLLAERTGIDVISNFRVRDVAAGGQGAPLVPGFHRRMLAGRQHGDAWQAVLNLGGIANLTLLGPGDEVLGFDCGPGNVLLDLWAGRHLGKAWDDDGAWAAGGRVVEAGLGQLLATPFVRQPAPKSTGRDLFNGTWLDAQLTTPAWQQGGRPPRAEDVQATLAEFTAASVAVALDLASPPARPLEAVWVCGGGTRNADLMRRLQRRLAPARVQTTAALGLDPQWVESAAFAWLAACHVQGIPASIPAVTGARRACILGTRHCA